jgi:hypothetical protein
VNESLNTLGILFSVALLATSVISIVHLGSSVPVASSTEVHPSLVPATSGPGSAIPSSTQVLLGVGPPTTSTPANRTGAASAYDPAIGGAIMFGGLSIGPGGRTNTRNDTWEFVDDRWIHLHPARSPPPTSYAVATYDGSAGAVIMFGGFIPSGISNQTWEFTNNNWTDLTPGLNRSPPGRYLPGFVFDPREGGDILFGGTYPSDTWLFANGSWTQLFPPRLPPPRYEMAMAYDAKDHEVVMYGGRSLLGTEPAFNDTWVFKGGTWTNVTKHSPSSPGPRVESDMTWDGHDGYLLLFGGATVGAPVSASTWSFVGGVWTNRTFTPAPQARYGGVLVSDPKEGVVILFGGQTTVSPTFLGTTWLYRAGVWS